jgi:glycosyltransferase involved in cell wall biosynthesis
VLSELDWTMDGPPVVGYLGRFVPEKGIELLTSALDQVASEWRALFVGGGPLEARLRDWASRHDGRVRIAGGVSHEKVPSYLNAMDLLCAPSQTTPSWREQLGRMIIEAFACGVPVVASDSGEIPYVAGDAGVVVGERDIPGWTAAIAELLESPTKRSELAERGIERARSKFDWPVVASATLDFFDEIVENQNT